MNDLVERLRGFADTDMPLEALAVVLEAADEIERLKAQLQQALTPLWQPPVHQSSDPQQADHLVTDQEAKPGKSHPQADRPQEPSPS